MESTQSDEPHDQPTPARPAPEPATDEPVGAAGEAACEAAGEADSKTAGAAAGEADSEAASETASEAVEGAKLPSVWNVRTVVVIAIGVALVLCLSGLIIGYHEYNKVAEPDRSTPETSVEQFISATFNDRDPSRAAQLTCAHPVLDEVDAMKADLTTRESQFSTQMRVDTANYSAHIDGTSATVDVDLKVTTTVSRSIRRWEFTLRQQGGWRICEAHRLG